MPTIVRPRARLSGLALAMLSAMLVVSACGTTTSSPSADAASVSPSDLPAPSRTPRPATSPGADLIRFEPVAAGLDQPLDIAAANDGTGRIFVAERTGRIRTVRDGVVEATSFLDITDRIKVEGAEQGLLGIALHPNFPTDGRIFADYTDLDGNTVVSSFSMSLDGDVVDAASEHVLLEVEQPFPNHNGGALAFGDDGMLYISLGDGGSGGDPQGNGQRLDTLLAKILRIDIDAGGDGGRAYGIPSDNPYADGADGARPEIWLTGLRNAWRIRFDRPTGDMWIGDVGQDDEEEIDVVRAGAGGQNLGWNIMEGSRCFATSEACDQTGLLLPVAEYGHSLGCAVVGGVVIHDPTAATLDGRYIFADNCSGNVFVIEADGDGRRKLTLALESGRPISAIADDGSGVVYATDLGSGELLRVEEAGS